MSRRAADDVGRGRGRWLPKLAVALLSVLLVDCGLSAYMWRAGRHPMQSVDSIYRMPHPVYHHTLRPNVSYDAALWGPIPYPLRTNSLGFRDAEVRTVPLEAHGYRLLLIGDSFTEGLGVPYAETFAGLLGAHLAPRGIEVLNAGVLSYAPSIYLSKTRQLLEDGLTFDRLVVLLDLSDIADEVDRYGPQEPNERAATPSWSAKLIRLLRRRTVLIGALVGRLTRDADDTDRDRDTTRDLRIGALNRKRCLWSSNAGLFEAYGRKGLAQATERMDELAELLRARGIQLSLVVYPWPDQIALRDLESRQVVHWRAWAERNGAHFVDAFPAFIHDEPAQAVIDTLFIERDVHFNRAGHAVLERVLFESLMTVLPD